MNRQNLGFVTCFWRVDCHYLLIIPRTRVHLHGLNFSEIFISLHICIVRKFQKYAQNKKIILILDIVKHVSWIKKIQALSKSDKNYIFGGGLTVVLILLSGCGGRKCGYGLKSSFTFALLIQFCNIWKGHSNPLVYYSRPFLLSYWPYSQHSQWSTNKAHPRSIQHTVQHP